MKPDIRKRILKTFLELIAIDEVYPHEKEVLTYVESYLARTSVQTKRDSFNNIIGYVDGVGEPILLNTHVDVPENAPHIEYILEGDIIRSAGTSILGADPKSGLAVLLELISYIKENKIITRPLGLVFTRGEEAGLYGAINLDYSLISAKEGLVIDEDGPCTNIVIQAPGFYRLDVEILGKTVHPRDWKDGINALAIAAKAISGLQQGEITSGVTFNIGMFESGTARNSVPGSAAFKAELRSFDREKLLSAAKHIEVHIKHVAESMGADVNITGVLEFEGYKADMNSSFLKRLKSVFKKRRLKPNFYPTYGGSDANVINAHGIVALPIGSAYYLAHQYTEYVNMKEAEDLLLFITDLIAVK